jgi:hypothetical protein
LLYFINLQYQKIHRASLNLYLYLSLPPNLFSFSQTSNKTNLTNNHTGENLIDSQSDIISFLASINLLPVLQQKKKLCKLMRFFKLLLVAVFFLVAVSAIKVADP